MLRKIYDFNTKIPPRQLGYADYFLISENEYKKTEKISGVEIKPKTINELIKQVKKFKKANFIILTTQDYEIKRRAVDKSLVDAIAHNETESKRSKRNYRYSGIDHVIAKKCAETNVSVNICFNDFLNAENRGIILGRMKQNVRLCLKYKAPIIISSGAENTNELVPADNLVAFAEFLGMNRKQALESVSRVAEKIIKREKK
jgi:ribonuclease P/MRP protein subunit RPP1